MLLGVTQADRKAQILQLTEMLLIDIREAQNHNAIVRAVNDYTRRVETCRLSDDGPAVLSWENIEAWGRYLISHLRCLAHNLATLFVVRITNGITRAVNRAHEVLLP